MSIKKYINKTIELFNNIFPCLQRNHKQIKDKPTTSTDKEQNDEDFFQTNRITTRRIYKNIKKYGQISLALGQILLFLLVAGSALNYAKIYVLDLRYQVDLTFEQFITFGFSNLIYVILYILSLYIPIEFPIVAKLMYPRLKWWGIYVLLFIILYFIAISSYLLINSFQENSQFLIVFILYCCFVVSLSIFIILGKKNQYIIFRFLALLYTFFIFLQTDYSTTRMSGIGKYNATIMVDKNSFIKDMFDDLDNKNKKYHNKGDHIELKDVKVLSTLGDIAYVELCSENIEISKKLEENCRKTIKVEFIKKDIHIIRDGEKQDVSNAEDCSDKTNNENKEQNEQDLEKSKENNKEESTTKNN